MKKLILFVCGIILLGEITSASESCFIAKDKDQIIRQEGDFNKRYAPCSTFKIALSLIGYDTGILIDEMNPVWPFKHGYSDFLEAWKQDQSPRSWIKNSCV